MATQKWMYADLSEKERLDLINGGNLQVYKNEKDRVNDLITSYGELGLDTSELQRYSTALDNTALSAKLTKEQVQALNGAPYMTLKTTIGAVAQGGSGAPSSSTGLAQSEYQRSLDALRGEYTGRADQVKSDALKEYQQQLDTIHRAYDRADEQARGDYSQKKQDLLANSMGALPSLRESLANAGLHFDGGRARTEEFRSQSDLTNNLVRLEGQLQQALTSSGSLRQADVMKTYAEYKRGIVEQLDKLEQMLYTREKDAADAYQKQQSLDFDREKFYAALQQQQTASAEDARRWESEYGLKKQAQAASVERDRFDMAKFDREFEAKQAQQAVSNQQWAKEVALKEQSQRDQLDFDKERFEREYALKLASSQLDRQKWESESAMKSNAQRTSYEQWLREQALKEMTLDNSITQSDRSYALALLKNQQAQEQWQKEFDEKQRVTDAELELKRAAAQSKEQTAKDAKASPTATSKANPDNEAELSYYINTAKWMKSQEKLTPYGLTKLYSHDDLTKWTESLPLSVAQKIKLLKELYPD